MFILLPIRHEQTTVRRYPWVTIGLIVSCALAFILTGRYQPSPREDRSLRRNVPRAMKWYLDHPYLELSPEFREIFMSGVEEEELRRMLGAGEPSERPESERAIELEQRQMDKVAARAVGAYRSHSLLRWGLQPVRPGPLTLFSHMFLHAGWFHLIGNMLLLFLAGPFIEDVWGRPIYAAVYVVAGLAAALFHIGANPGSSAPLVGASGAIAGLMGAFLVRYSTTRIKFFFLFVFVRGTFHAPAWVMLPLWFAHQVILGARASMNDISTGVAHWAHVGGFVVGVGAALAMRRGRVEERFIDPVIDAKVSLRVEENEAVDRALALRAAGDAEQSFRLLGEAVRRHPGNPDGASALWDVACDLDRIEAAAPSMLLSIQSLLRSGRTEEALGLWLAVQKRVQVLEGDPRLFVRIARALIDAGRGRDAIAPLRLALLRGGTRLDPTTAMKIACAARKLDPQTARGAARLALAHPDVDPQLREQAMRLLEEVPSPPSLVAST